MLISYSWLAAMTSFDADAHELARRLTARGLTVDGVTAAGDDWILDIDVPANRPDALGHRGVAREVAAAFGGTLAPTAPSRPHGVPLAGAVDVTLAAPELCRRYTAGIVRGVRVGPSPGWVAHRLESCGLRSINNVVDVSNLVMLELGQPVHFFDRTTLRGTAIQVRRSRPGETLTTLDGVTRTLDAEVIVIADASGAVALGGVIGGAATEITEATTDVVVEAAWFLPAAVRKTARTLGVVTDAGQRFERGCDPEAPPLAQDLAASLLQSLAGGRPDPAIVDVYPEPFPRRRMSVRAARVERLLGYAPARAEAERALAAVGLAPEATVEGFDVTVPSWRVDLEREADLVEEIGRDLGYDRIPSRVPASAPRGSSRVEAPWDERVRDRFAALGFAEAFNYAMVGPGDDAGFVTDGTPPPLPLTNPIAEPMGWLRRALAPGLLRAADQNVRRGVSDVRLFEVGSIFLARRPGELPDEPLRAAFAWCGTARPAHWSEPARAADAMDAAGLVEDILALTQGERDLARRPADLPGLHPGRSTLWTDAAGRRVAWCGPVHPDLAAHLDLSGTVLLGEIDLSNALPRVAVAYRPVPRVPGMTRDLSILLEPGTAAGAVLTAVRAVAAPAPVRFQWIDRFEGEPLPAGHAAMTLRVILQPLDRTLTDDEAESFRNRLVTALEEVSGARLRRIDT